MHHASMIAFHSAAKPPASRGNQSTMPVASADQQPHVIHAAWTNLHTVRQHNSRPCDHDQPGTSNPAAGWAAASAAHATGVETKHSNTRYTCTCCTRQNAQTHGLPSNPLQTACQTQRTKRKPTNTQQLCDLCCIASCRQLHSHTLLDKQP